MEREVSNEELRGLITQGFAQVNHRLDQVNGKVGKAHDRISKVEAFLQGLREQVETMRSTYHAAVNALQTKMAAPMSLQQIADFDKRPVTLVEARWLIGLVIACFCAGGVTIVWILKLIGKL